MSEDLRSFYTAVILSVLVVVGVNYFFPRQQPVEQQEVTVIKGSADGKITTEEIAQVEKSDEQNIAAEPVYENVEEVLQRMRAYRLKIMRFPVVFA